MRRILIFLAQPISVQLGQGHLRTHENNQLAALLTACRGTEKRADKGKTREVGKALIIFLLSFFNQPTQNDGRSVRRGNIRADITGGDGRDQIATDIYVSALYNVVDLLQNI